MPKSRWQPVFVLCLMLGSLVWAGAASGGPAHAEDERASTPMLEVTIDALAPKAGGATLARRVGDVSRHVKSLSGFERTDVATVPGSPARLLRATVWSSIESLEAASLARDGHTSETAMRASVEAGQRKRWYLRQLRSERYADGPTGHLEVTLYRTRAGTTREQNLARFDQAEADFAKGDGILGHSMWIAPDGLWAHVVHWQSKEAFAKTGRALMQTKGVGAWIRSLDFKRFKVWKGDAFATR